MKNFFFFIALALAFTSCRSPLLGNKPKTGISVSLSIPDNIKSNVPEGILKALGKSVAPSMPRLIHPEAKRIVGTIKTIDRTYKAESILEEHRSKVELNFNEIPINTSFSLKIELFSSNNALLGEANKTVQEGVANGNNTISLVLKPLEYQTGEFNNGFLKYNSLPDPRPSSFVLEIPAPTLGAKGIYRVDTYFSSYLYNYKGLYKSNGELHKGAITVEDLGVPYTKNKAENIYFGYDGEGTEPYYLVLTDVGLNPGEIINIYYSKSDHDFLVTGYESYDEFYNNNADPAVFEYSSPYPGAMDVGFYIVGSMGNENSLPFTVFNPYEESVNISLSVNSIPSVYNDFYTNETSQAILPGKKWIFNVALRMLQSAGASSPYYANADGDLVMSAQGMDDFKMLFYGITC